MVLDNGRVHYFDLKSEQSGSFTIRGHKIQSIAPGYYHVVMVTMSGAVFGFGRYPQVDVVDPSALLDYTHGEGYGKYFRPHNVSRPTEVFAVVMKSKGGDRLPDGKEQ